jgi:hypothetical protein
VIIFYFFRRLNQPWVNFGYRSRNRMNCAALLDDVPHLPVEGNLEDHAVTVTTLRSAYGSFFDVAYNPSRGLTPGYGYDPNTVLASFRLLAGRLTALQTLCLAESGLDLSALPLVS